MEHTCERVIIIDRGKLVAIDSVANLTNRLRGAEAVAVEVEAAGGQPNPTDVQQRLEQVPGVSRVVMKDSRDGRLLFEVESLQGRHIRADLARAVVNAGWNLNELRAVGLSLEESSCSSPRPNRKRKKRSRPPKEARSNEERTPHLPERTQELLRVAHRLRRDGDFRADLRLGVLQRHARFRALSASNRK